MKAINAIRVLHRPFLAATAGLAFLTCQNTFAVTLVVDGDTSDLSAAVATLPDNVGSVSESGTDGESNGFDITDAYAHYDVSTDTFYIGMNFLGQVGTSGGDEGLCFSCPEFGVAGVFDSNETYGFNIIRDSDSATLVDLRLTGNSTTGGETISSQLNPFGASLVWSVSESNNGVEFSIAGLEAAGALGNFSLLNPTDVTIGFFAGSISNPALEDEAYINMQVVPVPAAAWLFASGLLGLVSTARRRSKK